AGRGRVARAAAGAIGRRGEIVRRVHGRRPGTGSGRSSGAVLAGTGSGRSSGAVLAGTGSGRSSGAVLAGLESELDARVRTLVAPTVSTAPSLA
ncbi:MAG: hypothetical protein ACYCU3_22330, partial [Streptosporangiaceae bacterium]